MPAVMPPMIITTAPNAPRIRNPAPTKASTEMNRTHGLVPASCLTTPSVIAEPDEWLEGMEVSTGDA